MANKFRNQIINTKVTAFSYGGYCHADFVDLGNGYGKLVPRDIKKIYK